MKFSTLVEQIEDGIAVENQSAEFPIHRTLVMKFFRQSDGQDLAEECQSFLHDNLGISEINVQKAKSMSRDKDGYGTVKVLLESKDQLKRVLDVKKELSEVDDYDVNCVRIRQSKTTEQLVFEQNCDVLMKEMDLFHDYYRSDQGWLIPRNSTRANRGRMRGRARGRARGSLSGRPNFNSNYRRENEYHQSNDRNNQSYSDVVRGQHRGGRRRETYPDRRSGDNNGYNPHDARIAQRDERRRNGMQRDRSEEQNDSNTY